MKPGKNDRRYKIRISGAELAELHRLSPMMCDAFGLDRKIGAYKGTRAITLFAWDLDCLEEVVALALREGHTRRVKLSPAGRAALISLGERFRDLRRGGA
jgi:hypothetical protein